jgi:hypothetical protein
MSKCMTKECLSCPYLGDMINHFLCTWGKFDGHKLLRPPVKPACNLDRTRNPVLYTGRVNRYWVNLVVWCLGLWWKWFRKHEVVVSWYYVPGVLSFMIHTLSNGKFHIKRYRA